MKWDFDVIIVGASLAGASLALRLARMGISCALLDKAIFPRDKVCGEGLSSAGYSSLVELGLASSFSPLPFNGYQIVYGRNHSLLSSKTLCTHGYGVKRFDLDSCLIDLVKKEASLEMFQGQQVRAFASTGNQTVVNTARGDLSCSQLIVAEGANALLANNLGAKVFRKSKLRFGFSLELIGKFSRTLSQVIIQLEANCEIFVTSTSCERINVSVLCDAEDIKKLSSVASVTRIVESACSVSHFTPTECRYIGATGPISEQSRSISQKGIFLLGDCAATLDPIGGMGMTHALLSAKLYAPYLKAILDAPAKSTEITRVLECKHQDLLNPLRGFSRLTYLGFKYLPSLVCNPRYVPQRLVRFLQSGLPQQDLSTRPKSNYSRSILRLAGRL